MTRSLAFGYRTLLFASALMASAARPVYAQASSLTVPSSSRIVEQVDDAKLVSLKGSVHKSARMGQDQGLASDSLQITRALLLLQRSPQQEASLRQLLDEQQNKTSGRYHQWLDPQQFGLEFGPADADIQTITRWLASHGFQNVGQIPAER